MAARKYGDTASKLAVSRKISGAVRNRGSRIDFFKQRYCSATSVGATGSGFGHNAG